MWEVYIEFLLERSIDKSESLSLLCCCHSDSQYIYVCVWDIIFYGTSMTLKLFYSRELSLMCWFCNRAEFSPFSRQCLLTCNFDIINECYKIHSSNEKHSISCLILTNRHLNRFFLKRYILCKSMEVSVHRIKL